MLSKKEIGRCLVWGRFKWYRRRRGGYWSKVVGCPHYWIRRRPFQMEIAAGHVLATENYEED
jgi:hypothetical protein